MSRPFLARVDHKVRETFHCWMGSLHLRRGDLGRAQEHYLKALSWSPDSFRAHLSLGRIHLHEERLGRAVEELQRAREIDPHRFAREGFPGDPLLWMAERLPEARLHRNLVPGTAGGSGLGPDREPTEVFTEEEVDDLPFGDFSDCEEARRFSLLPPIAFADVDDIDWGELGRELTEDR